MAQQQSSRLHRLLTLLDTGSTKATRYSAARQIGDVAKSHPQDLNTLLKKVSQYLHSKNWDTRVAAAHAIGAIAENVNHTSLSELLARVKTKMSEAGISGVVEDEIVPPNSLSDFVSGFPFKSFDINKVLEFGALLASAGQEYDVCVDPTKNPKERLARQKQNLQRRLGLDICEQFMDFNDMIRDEDLIVHKLDFHGNGVCNKFYTSQPVHSIHQIVANMVPNFKSARPSARELNLLKRKAKVNTKDQTKGWPEDGDGEALSYQNMITPKGSPDCTSPRKICKDAIVDEESLEDDGDGRWPFNDFVEQLILDMFDPVWEVRHGSVMALREILTYQGASAGVFMPDLSSDSILFIELKDRDNLKSQKRERNSDLNLGVPLEESEPSVKRMKLERTSSTLPDNLITDAVDASLCASVKVEDSGLHFPAQHINGQLNVGSVKVEPESVLDETPSLLEDAAGTVELRGHFEDKVLLRRTNILENVSENRELMNLAKLARHSWLRHCEFLQDCAIRFLCVLSLDRFGDYISDQVVAPVRETCAQALGVVLKYMHPLLVHETLKILLQMQHRPEWEIRHGSLLGIKYLVAVRQEMLDDLLGYVLPACKAGLEDPDDDVRAVAAEALIPAAPAIVSLRGPSLQSIVMLLWDILLNLDDLSPSTSSVMNLLAEIYSQEEMIPMMSGAMSSKEKQEIDLNETARVGDLCEGKKVQGDPYVLSSLAPRLWPFVRHSITSVRYSAIRTLERLLEAGHKRIISVSTDSIWPSSILGETLRIVFQNMLLESNEEILHCSEKVWRLLAKCCIEDLESAAKPHISSWIELATTPYGSALDTRKMFWPVALPRKSLFRAAAKMRVVKLENDLTKSFDFDSFGGISMQDKIGDNSTNSSKIIVGSDTEMSVTHTRVVSAAALGVLASKFNEESMNYVINPLWKALTSSSGVQRQVASMVLISWFKEIKSREHSGAHGAMLGLPHHFKNWLLDLLACTDPSLPTKNSRDPYAELSRTYAKMHGEASQLLHAVESCGMFTNMLKDTKFDLEKLSVDAAISFISKILPVNYDVSAKESTEGQIMDELESLKQRLLATSGYLKCVQSNLHVTVSALVAAAVVWMSELPVRLNPIILPLMASIKREQEETLQEIAAEALAELISHCITRKPSPNDKLIKNICSLTCTDPCETPHANVIHSMEIIEDQDFLLFKNIRSKQKSKVHVVAGGEERSRIEGFISRRGSELALNYLCKKFGDSLFDKLPRVWDCLTEVLKPVCLESITPYEEQIRSAVDSVQDPQILINNIQVVRSITPLLNENLKPKLLTLLPCIFRCICHSHVAVRLAASRSITIMAKSMTENVMGAVLENVIPMLSDMLSIHARQGAGMLLSLLVQELGVVLVPYAPLLVVPLLRCMSDCDSSVRQSVTRSFAALVPLLPLARGVPPPPGLVDKFPSNTEDMQFLEQLLDNSHIDDYNLHIHLKVTLRRYQQEGVNWLAFLRRFKLHGILCDDMGLGKTLQASAIVASDIVEYKALDSREAQLPSVIVCPSTLVGHWAYEIEKYIDVSVIHTLQYVGSAEERFSLQRHFSNHNIIVTSYDVVRKDTDYLGQLVWNYCILDEGHIIKNAKSKVTCAVKQLKAQHRLILSGTPIQNNVLDLWSLFDFLMPGFLGTERQFQATYGKPLVAARDSKCSAKDAEAGALAMEALHKQVMPFLLRRTKSEVLSDLPEKIIQDRYCDLSPVQLKLYEQFSGSHVRQEISSIVKLEESDDKGGHSVMPKASSHVFQALQYLLKLCSHPALVVGGMVSDSLATVLSEVLPQNSDFMSELHKVHHSPKLIALQEILEECGIGLDSSPSASEGNISVGQHRVLIFAQHKAFLDIIEKDLFQTRMKSVTYLRLDGSVQPEKRFDIVKAFNADPTIDALLLTTHVGGLGLNLTSADTLIFMEHDWNPMRDHQAMDRAHRLGQQKVVHVHRLIMRGTLEEKVMGLQKFKLSVANAVINSENASLKTMNTDQLLDLFTSSQSSRKGISGSKSVGGGDVTEESKSAVGGGRRLKSILSGLEELWDQSQYTEEYNLSQLLAKLNG